MARTTTRLFCAGAMHLARTRHAHSMRTPWARCAHAMHTPCTRHAMRRYRGAFRTLERAVDWWNLLLEPPTFIAQLGDIIDGVNVDLGQSDSALEARAFKTMHSYHAHAAHAPRKCHAHDAHAPCTCDVHAVHAPCTCHPGGAGDAAPRAVPSGQHRRQPRALQLRPRAAGEGEWRGRVAQARRQGVPQLRACRRLAQHVNSGELRRSQEPAHFWVAPGRVLLCGQC